jgi:hypothetical protein
MSQNVAAHTWQVMRIWWQIFGPLPEHISTALIWHDAGELVTGDPPFPLKAESPELKTIYDRLESQAVLAMGGPDEDSLRLGGLDRVRAKICDLIEMMEYGLHERAMGNCSAQPIIDDTERIALQLAKQLDLEQRIAVQEYVTHVRKNHPCT